MKSLQIFILSLVFVLMFSGCKREKTLEGMVNVSGKVTDIISKAPLKKAIVTLVGVEQRNNEIGYADVGKVVALDTTDEEGNYNMSYNCEGKFYRFEINADPKDPLYMGEQGEINSTGDHIRDINCNRSAYAQITLTNKAPIDTPYAIVLSSQYGNIVLNHFYKDTIVYLKMSGSTKWPNELRFNKDNIYNEYPKVTAGPWDTIPMQFKY